MAAGAMRYGFGYQGSKNKICRWLMEHLPRGKRFCDLFGGGFAVSHAALLSGKYKSVFYNEINKDIFDIVRRYILNKEPVPMQWISREDFSRLKDTDPVVSLFWSFNQNRSSYLYSVEIEPWKKALHYARVLGDRLPLQAFDIDSDGSRANIRAHEKEYKEKYIKWYLETHKEQSQGSMGSLGRLQDLGSLGRLQDLESPGRLQDLESLGRLQDLESLQSLQSLKRLEVNCGSYLDYEYKEGDVVYCDPPYENTNTEGYKNIFDSKQFYDWVFNCPFQVFFSSYEISDDRFYELDFIEKTNNFTNLGSAKKNIERLYSNKPFPGAQRPQQTTIFDFLKE